MGITKRAYLGKAVKSCSYHGKKILKWEDVFGQESWSIDGLDVEFMTKEDAKAFIDDKGGRYEINLIID